MNRLTIKHNCIGTTTYEKAISKSQYDIKGCNLTKVFNKLGQLEDIEEKIGINLNIIVNLDTFYSKGDDGKIYKVHIGTTKYDNREKYIDYIDFKNLCIYEIYFYGGTCMGDRNLYFKDYGITWALTKKELS